VIKKNFISTVVQFLKVAFQPSFYQKNLAPSIHDAMAEKNRSSPSKKRNSFSLCCGWDPNSLGWTKELFKMSDPKYKVAPYSVLELRQKKRLTVCKLLLSQGATHPRAQKVPVLGLDFVTSSHASVLINKSSAAAAETAKIYLSRSRAGK